MKIAGFGSRLVAVKPYLRGWLYRYRAPQSLFVVSLVCSVAVAGQYIPPSESHANPTRPLSPAGVGFTFEENRGQSDAAVRYLAHGLNEAVLLEDTGAVLQWVDGTDRWIGKRLPGAESPRSHTSSVQLRLVRPSDKAKPRGEHRLNEVVNYFAGNVPEKWHTGIPTFDKVRYPDVYHGIDLIFRCNHSRLEFDFQVAANANPKQIEVRFEGAHSLHLSKSGDLIVAGAHGSIRLLHPTAFQADGEGGSQVVSAAFEILRHKKVRFRLGRYNREKSLTIDPVLNYSTYVGSGGYANAIAVDSAGNSYIAGLTFTGFPTTPGIEPNPAPKPNGGWSAYIAKLDTSGSSILFATYLSGNGNDEANCLTVDSSDNIFVVGATSSTDFPVTPGAFQTSNRETDSGAFAAKINSAGTALIYSSYLGGSYYSDAYAVAVDSAGNAYVGGATSDSDFPVTPGAFQTSVSKDNADDWTGFVTKLNASGSGLVYSTLLGGSGLEWVAAVSADANGNAYAAGNTESKNFPVTAGAPDPVNRAVLLFGLTAFVAKLNSSGTALLYSTYLGGSGADRVNGMILDGSGSAYLAGFTQSADFPVTPGVVQTTFQQATTPGSTNAFLSRMNAAGTGLLYSTFLSGSRAYGAPDDEANAIALDSSGNAYVSGSANTLDFPVTSGALETNNVAELQSGGKSSFFVKINPAATKILYGTYLSGSGDGSGLGCDCTNGIAIGPSGNVYLTGFTVSSDFPTTAGALQSDYPYDGFTTFVAQFNGSELISLPATTTVLSSDASTQIYGQPVTFTATARSGRGNTPTGTIGFSFAGLESANAFPGQLGAWFSVPLDQSGTAQFTTSALATGQNAVVAHYLGDGNSAPSVANMVQTIVGRPTTVTLASSENPAPYGTPVVLTATVRDSSGNPVPGNVLFATDTVALGEATVDSAGQASWTNGTSGFPLQVGTQLIAAGFTGVGYAPSSASFAQTFNALGTLDAPTFSPPGGIFKSVQSVALADGSPKATIYYTTDGSLPVVGSSESYSGTPLQVSASQTITAVAGQPGFIASPPASATYILQLPNPDFTISIMPDALTIKRGQSATATVTVLPQHGFYDLVSFTCSGLPPGATCAFFPSSIAAGGTTSVEVSVSATTSENDHPWTPPTGTVLLAIILFPWRARHTRRLSDSLRTIIVATLVALMPTACGGGSGTTNSASISGGQPAVTSIEVVGTSGSLIHPVVVTLTLE